MWTGSDSTGSFTPTPFGGCSGNCTCSDWSASGSGGGVAGSPFTTTPSWSITAQVQCDLPQHLYCVQQVP